MEKREPYCDEVDNAHGHCQNSGGCHDPPEWHSHVILTVIIVVEISEHRDTHDDHNECQGHKACSLAQLRYKTSEEFVEEWQLGNNEDD